MPSDLERSFGYWVALGFRVRRAHDPNNALVLAEKRRQVRLAIRRGWDYEQRRACRQLANAIRHEVIRGGV